MCNIQDLPVKDASYTSWPRIKCKLSHDPGALGMLLVLQNRVCLVFLQM